MVTEGEVWVSVNEGTVNLRPGGGISGTFQPGDTFAVGRSLADAMIARGWVAEVEAPERDPEPDRSDWVAVRVLSEINPDGGKSYGADEILDLSPSEVERYVGIGAVEVVE